MSYRLTNDLSHHPHRNKNRIEIIQTNLSLKPDGIPLSYHFTFLETVHLVPLPSSNIDSPLLSFPSPIQCCRQATRKTLHISKHRRTIPCLTGCIELIQGHALHATSHKKDRSNLVNYFFCLCMSFHLSRPIHTLSFTTKIGIHRRCFPTKKYPPPVLS